MLSSIIKSFMGNDIVNQEQSFGSSQAGNWLFNPVIQAIAWAIAQYYRNDFRIGPKPLSTPVHNVVSQGGTNNDNIIEMIKVLPLE